MLFLREAAIETLVTAEERGESPQRSKYLEKSILAPVTEGFTENLNVSFCFTTFH